MTNFRIIVYSDFLCPWCYNVYTKLEAVLADVEATWGERPDTEWRAFLLRPESKPGRDREKFREYTKGWLRVAEDEPRADFRVWASDAAPPTHSVPAHLVAKAANALGPGAGAAMRERLFRAYFSENRDISDADTLEALWRELDLPEEHFASHREPALEEQVWSEYREAMECGATGVPAVRMADQDFVLMGAQPEAMYRRWFERRRAEA